MHSRNAASKAASVAGQIHDGSTPCNRSSTSPTAVEITGRLHISASLTAFGEPSSEDVTTRQSAALISAGIVTGSASSATWSRKPAAAQAASASQRRFRAEYGLVPTKRATGSSGQP